VAWKDVIENPRADGVPSAKLQPEEFKTYIAQNGAQDSNAGAQNNPAVVAGRLKASV
jgi:flagellar protein FliS